MVKQGSADMPAGPFIMRMMELIRQSGGIRGTMSKRRNLFMKRLKQGCYEVLSIVKMTNKEMSVNGVNTRFLI